MTPDEVKPPVLPTTETTTEKHETVVTKGDAELTAAVVAGPRFDDWVRAGLSYIVVGTLSFMVVYGQMTGHEIPSDKFTIYVSLATGAYGFYIGSSYGSNQKDKAAK